MLKEIRLKAWICPKETGQDEQKKDAEGRDTDEQQQQDFRTATARIASTGARTGLVILASSRTTSWKEKP